MIEIALILSAVLRHWADVIVAGVLLAFSAGLVRGDVNGWPLIGLVWAYAIAWVFAEDAAKLAVYRHLGRTGRRHQAFLSRVQETLHLGA